MVNRPVSLCLLTYKRAHMLPRTLESLLSQSYTDFELIINDDCSPDETAQVCREFERRDSRVRYFRNRTNLRYANNQNAAMLRASHDYVGIVHDGDLYHPSMVERWVLALDAHPTAAIVFNAAEHMDRESRTVQIYEHPYGPLTAGRAMLDDMLGSENSPIFGIVMVRRSHVLSVGPFDPRLPTLADVDMWMRLLLDHDVAYVKEPLYKIGANEAGHHNSFKNWRVRKEVELIYALNWRRRFASDPAAAEGMRLRIARMLRRRRLLQLIACVRYLQPGPLLDGLRFIQAEGPFGATAAPDRVTDWNAIKRLVD